MNERVKQEIIDSLDKRMRICNDEKLRKKQEIEELTETIAGCQEAVEKLAELK